VVTLYDLSIERSGGMQVSEFDVFLSSSCESGGPPLKRSISAMLPNRLNFQMLSKVVCPQSRADVLRPGM
jgi:hypothetical protein